MHKKFSTLTALSRSIVTLCFLPDQVEALFVIAITDLRELAKSYFQDWHDLHLAIAMGSCIRSPLHFKYNIIE
jgi:hypothetical protein